MLKIILDYFNKQLKESSGMMNILEFLKNNISPYHLVARVKEELIKNDFIELNVYEKWTLEKGRKYFYIKNDASLVAFKLPNDQANLKYIISASHVDHPTFKVKPQNKIEHNNNFYVNTSPYGGLILSTFFDRPLSIAGRVFVNENGVIKNKLVNFDRDLMIIPSLPIHFGKVTEPNPQTDMLPIMSLESENSSVDDLLKKEAKIENYVSYDLFLYNCDEYKIFGANNEFLGGVGLDDALGVFTSLVGFIRANDSNNINVLYLTNNEEVGSMSNTGADSNVLDVAIKRINKLYNLTDEEQEIALAKSLLISVDNAHAFNNNFASKYDNTNRVYLNKGVVIKHSANMLYTTDAISNAMFKSCLDKKQIPYQEFVNRSDIRGGSTLGAILLSHVSINSIDIGLPQLAMHSAYETSGLKDIDYMIDAIKAMYEADFIFKEGQIIIR